jgi:hypothetical protein
MKFSRRHFIKLGGATAMGTLGLGSLAFGQKNSFFADRLPDSSLANPSFNYTADEFRKYLGTKFYLMRPGATDTVKLTAVKSSVVSKNITARSKRAECFTLTFQLPSNAPQATYTVSHPRLGTFSLLLVPGNNDKAESLLHAVVNRI